jgi:hypothetical protein
MANIVKLQDDLKGIPLKNLIMYVQNPNGQVPSYLALSEIKRRKDMEQRAMAEQNAPSHLSVAEELTAPRQNIGPQFDTPQTMMAAQKQPQQGIPAIPPQQMAQGGIADLNPGNMYDDKHYASGGIVAFDDGGEVQHFDEGGTSRLGDYFRNLRATNLEKQKENKLINDLLTEKYRIEGDVFSKLTPEQKAAQDNALKQIDVMLSEAKAKKATGSSNAPTTIPGAGVMGSQAAADKMFGAPYDPAQSLGYKGPPLKTVREPGAPGVYDEEKIRSLGDYAKDLQDYLGPDKNINLQRERLAKMEDRATRMEKDAPWLALTEAGFGTMAGTSPYALTNLGAGAQMGLKSYAAAQDKFAALEEKRLNLVMNMDQAERREKLAVAEFGAKSKEAAEERNFKRKLQKDLLDVKMAMNTDDNIKALMVAQEKNKPTVTEALKIQDYIAQNLPQEEKLILEDLGGNANVKGTKNYSAYLDRMEQARAKLATQGRTIPGMSVVSGSPVTNKSLWGNLSVK